MFNEDTVVSVVAAFNLVAGEANTALRKSVLQRYIEQITDEDEEYLVNLVLSFQMANMLKAPKVKFNTIPFDGFAEGLSLWLNPNTKEEIPYVMQSIIHFMSSPKSLNLRFLQVSDISFKYISPHTWLAENLKNFGTEIALCPVCSGELDADTICTTCLAELQAFTEYRSLDFILEVSPRTCRWLSDYKISPFSVMLDNYEVSSTSPDRITFLHIPDGQQAHLPFKEYQREIVDIYKRIS